MSGEINPFLRVLSVNFVPPAEIFNKWVANAPPGENRKAVAEKLISARSTGILKLEGDIMKNISSLPELPDEIKSVSINDAYNLQSLPAMPAVKELTLERCPALKIEKLPDSLRQLTIKHVSSISTLPPGLSHLSITSNKIPFLPPALLSLKLERCEGEVDLALMCHLKKVEVKSCAALMVISLPKELESLCLTGTFRSPGVQPSAAGTRTVTLLPQLPDKLQELSLSSHSYASELPVLPAGLKKIHLRNLSFTTDASFILPASLESLEISKCHKLILPTQLPARLLAINIVSRGADAITWDIAPETIPQGANVNLKGVNINPECYKRTDVTFDNIYTESSLLFRSGDVLYGAKSDRTLLTKKIFALNNFNKKEIVLQNKLTNAVWTPEKPGKFTSDAKIIQALNDGERGIAFKHFLGTHPRYNVTSVQTIHNSNAEKWSKTSKAGLEFQTKVRSGTVIFCADTLVNSIPAIATKDKSAKGDAITAHELRWLYRHRNEDYVKNNVRFSLGGRIVSHDTIFSLKGWELYHPKGMNGL